MRTNRKWVRRRQTRQLTWQTFAKKLADVLYDLESGEYLVLMVAGTEHFLQVADGGYSGMRLEAVSNAYLNPFFQLSDASVAHLLSLGWQTPTYVQSELAVEPFEGSPNFYIDFGCPVRTGPAALLAIRTLREVYGAITPSDLIYRAYSDEYESIRFGNLGIKSYNAIEFERAAIVDRIEPDQTTPIQLPVVMPVEVS